MLYCTRTICTMMEIRSKLLLLSYQNEDIFYILCNIYKKKIFFLYNLCTILNKSMVQNYVTEAKLCDTVEIFCTSTFAFFIWLILDL